MRRGVRAELISHSNRLYWRPLSADTTLRGSNTLIIFNSPINGRQYKKQHRKKEKSGNNAVTKHIDLTTTQYQTQAMTIHYTDLQNALSHALYLIKKCSLWRAGITLGNSKANSFWQFVTVSILLVLNIFIKNLSMTKSSELTDVLFNGQASRPYNKMLYVIIT